MKRPSPPLTKEYEAKVLAEARDSAVGMKLRKSMFVTDRDGGSFRLRIYTREHASLEGMSSVLWLLMENNVVIGSGRLLVEDGSARAGIAVLAKEYRRRGLYRAVLVALRKTLGVPIESDVSMTSGAIGAWKGAGAELADRRGDAVYRLNPGPKASFVDHWWPQPRTNPAPTGALTNPDDVRSKTVAAEIPKAVSRAVAAGAVLPLTYLGSGAYGNVFCDAANLAYKVSRNSEWGISEEAAWLRAANRIPSVREHVAKYYGYQNGVLIRECVKQREFGRKNERKIWELHERIKEAMFSAGWGAPEFKVDSYAVGSRGPVLFDASSAVRVGTNLARLVANVIEGAVDYPYPLSDLAYDVRMEVPRSITASVGKRLEERIERELRRRTAGSP